MTIGELPEVSPDLKEDIEKGVRILKAGGCVEVYILGSVAEGRSHADSDIDFAVRGCPPEGFFKLQGRLLRELSRSSDLIDLDVDPDLTELLNRESKMVHVG
jgi:predicted nucleotidyltransferase